MKHGNSNGNGINVLRLQRSLKSIRDNVNELIQQARDAQRALDKAFPRKGVTPVPTSIAGLKVAGRIDVLRIVARAEGPIRVKDVEDTLAKNGFIYSGRAKNHSDALRTKLYKDKYYEKCGHGRVRISRKFAAEVAMLVS